MFEKILEKVLFKFVGQFIDGIDKNNLKLSIWSGNIVIQNISVKPEVLKLLDIPVKMKYSHVGKLSVSIPWKSLGSRPIEILLEDILVIVEPVGSESWKDVDYKSVAKRLELIEYFVQSFTAMIAEKLTEENKDQKKDDRAMNKLTEKLIESIQVSIKNIHVRYENPLGKRTYAWGIVLEEIAVYTKNKDEKDNEPKKAYEPLRKALSLKNLGIYWSSNTTELFGDLAPAEAKQHMMDLILTDKTDAKRKMEYLIAISALCRLVQKNKRDPAMVNEPEFEISVDLKPLNIQLKKPQVEDLIDLLEMVTRFQKFKVASIKAREKEVENLTAEEKENMKEEFRVLFGRVQRNEKAQDLRGEEKLKVALGNDEVERYKYLIMSLGDDDLSAVMKTVLQEIEKERRIKAAEAQKLAQSQGDKWSGWFGWGMSKKEDSQDPDDLKLDDKDIEAIDKYIEETFTAEAEESAVKLEDLAYKKLFRINFTLEGGDVYVSNVTANGNEEGIALAYQGIATKIDVHAKGVSANLTLKDYRAYLRSREANTGKYTNLTMIRRVNHWMPLEATGNIVSLLIERNPQGRDDGLYVTLDSQAVEIIFRPAAVERIMQFINISITDESLKAQALEQIAKSQDQAAQAVMAVMQKSTGKDVVSIRVAAPVLIIPFTQNDDVYGKCWVVNFGDMLINTEEEETNMYIRYVFELKNLRFQDYPSQALYMGAAKSLKEKGNLSGLNEAEQKEYQNMVFDLIKQLDVKIVLDRMRRKVMDAELPKGRPWFNLNITIPNINIQLNPKTYKNLLAIEEIVNLPKEVMVETVEEDRPKLMVGHSKLGVVFVRETKIRDIVWNKYLCIFKGMYIYFFTNPTDMKPAFSYSIRGAEFEAKGDLEKPHVFMIKSYQNTGYIACDNEKLTNEWITLLKQKVIDYSAASTDIFGFSREEERKREEEKKLAAQKINYNVVNLALSFHIKELKASVFHREDKQLLDFNMRNIIVGLTQQEAQIKLKAKLGALEVVDYVVEETNPIFRKLVTTVPSESMREAVEDTDLIEVELHVLEKSHPSYNDKKINLEIKAKFGYLFINLKPLPVQEAMRFFIPPPADKKKKVEKIEVKEIKARTSVDTMYTQGTDHTLMKLNAELKEISVRILNQKTHICMAELAITNIKARVDIKPMLVSVSGSLGNIQLFETTNYPNTIDSNLNYGKVQPYEMIGIENQEENLVELKFRQLDPTNPEADQENKIFTYIDAQMNSLKINFLTQPTMRLVEYIIGNLVPAFTPEKAPLERTKTVIKLEKEVAEANLMSASFIDLKVLVKTPIIRVRPTPTSDEYIELRLGDIRAESERLQDESRFYNPTKPLDFVYCEKFNVELRNMCLYRVQGEKKTEMSKKIEIDISFERLLFEEEYKLVYSEGQAVTKEVFKVDNTMKLDGRMGPFIILASHEDFILIMKIVNYNVLYNDGLDKRLLSEVPEIVEEEEDIPETTEEQPAIPMQITMIFDSFTIMAFEKDYLPFAMANLHYVNLAVEIDKKKKVDLDVSVSELSGSYFENQGDEVLIERKMLGSLGRVEKFSIAGADRDQITENIIKATKSYVSEISVMHASKMKRDQIIVNVQIHPTKGEIVKINVDELKAHLISDISVHILDFMELDESVKAPHPAVQASQPKSILADLKEEPKKPKKTGPKKQGSLALSVEVKSFLVTVPSTLSGMKDPPNVLALKTSVNVSVTQYPSPSFEDSLIDVKNRTFTKAVEQCAQFNEVEKVSVTANQIEIFVCEFEDIKSDKKFNKVKKRNMLLPFTFTMTRKAHMVLNKERTELMTVSRNDMNAERLVFRVSYQDAMLINYSVQYQLKQLMPVFTKKQPEVVEVETEEAEEIHKHIPEPESVPESTRASIIERSDAFEESKESSRRTTAIDAGTPVSNMTMNSIATTVVDANREPWTPGLEDFTIASQGIQILIINDKEGLLVPVLEFTIYDVLLSMMKLPKQLRLGAKVMLSCSYFNPQPSKWEPFIEKFGVNFEMIQAENPKMEIHISTAEDFGDLNINLSEQMISILNSTFLREFVMGKLDTNQGISRGKEEDVINYVSPYTIVNNTGYPVDIFADLSNKSQGQARESTGKRPTFVPQTYHIENGASMQYLIVSDIDELFQNSNKDIMSMSTNKIVVKIIHSDHNILPIVGIDIDRLGMIGYPLAGGTSDDKDLLTFNYRMFSVVKIDQSKKIITLTSPFRITNTLQESCFITLEAHGHQVTTKLEPNQSTAVPVDFIQGTFSVKLDVPGATQSYKAPIKGFYGFENKMIEFPTGSFFIFAKPIKSDSGYDFFEVSLLPSFEVKNCCGLELSYRFVNNKDKVFDVLKLKPQETLHETRVSLMNPAYIQLKLQGYNWSDKFLIHSPDTSVKLAKRVIFQDATKNPLKVRIFVSKRLKGSRKICLYTKTCIINETPYDLLYYHLKDKKKMQVPGQVPSSNEVFNPKVTLFNKLNSLIFSKRNYPEISKPVNVGTMGSTGAELVHEDGLSMLDLGVHMSLLRCDKTFNLITKIITVSPRFILLNKTDYLIEVKREKGTRPLAMIEKGVRTPLYWNEWSTAIKEKNLSIRPIEFDQTPDFWNWSNGFDVQAVGLYNYPVQAQDKSKTKFFKTLVELEASTLFIIIEEEKVEKIDYKIKSTCPNVAITVYQTGANPTDDGVMLNEGDSIPWSWLYPNKKKEVSVSFSFGDVKNYHTADCKFSFDVLNTESKVVIPVSKDQKFEIFVSVVVEGSTRVLKFFVPYSSKGDRLSFLVMVRQIAKKMTKIPKEIVNLSLGVSIKGLGISIISSLASNKEKKTKERKEILYILLRGIEFRMDETTRKNSAQVRIKYLNIDNNTSYETSFPVLWTPTKPKALMDPTTKNYFLDALIRQRVTPEVTYIETLEVLLDGSTLKVDGMFIDTMMEVANNFINIFSSTKFAEGKRNIGQGLYKSYNEARKLEDTDYFESRYQWKYIQLNESTGPHIYIRKLVLNAILFNISFQLKKKDASEDAFFFLNLLTSVLGGAFANLDNSPLTLNGVVLENVFDSKDAIMKKLGTKYMNEAAKNIPKLLGSLDIVGNPVGLFTNISSGVIDLVEKPIHGFLQGPLEGGKGIVLGAGSLVKNTVSGAFNSIGKVTGSIASGLSNLTMDDEYLAEREKAKLKRPKHLGEGLVQGVTSIAKGVGEGFTGVFVKPIEGASKGGIKGFFKGTLQGVTGLVVKPVTGVLDAASNTAEGIKNTATVFDQKPNENKMRYPRPFYGKEKFYRTYTDIDAEIQWLLHFSEGQKYRDISILWSFDIFPYENDKEYFRILAISLESIICFTLKRNKIKWAVDTHNIDKVDQDEHGVVLKLKAPSDGFKDKKVHIKNCDQSQNPFIYKKIDDLVIFLKQQ